MLEKIVAKKYLEVAERKEKRPLNEFVPAIVPANHAFQQALSKAGWGLIAECKLASPSKGVLSPHRTVPELAAIYAANGATALSVLTDIHFQGTLQHIAAVKAVCGLPVLRKDFVVDLYQVFEARAAQADAILLIAAVLTDPMLKECLGQAQELGMDCIVEVHSREELKRVLALPAPLIGINNRDLTTFKTDIVTTRRLLDQTPSDRMIISESGVKSKADALQLRSWGAQGILVGEGLVTAPDIAAKTRELALRDDG
ncbi:MAG TPA: indole-3-glycerol phosphate synthase TrpC [Patescibacteria group bacterium]|nr:indole-3-glycerol phosphate synthase TrpC [Patescibacteria group bacterium]